MSAGRDLIEAIVRNKSVDQKRTAWKYGFQLGIDRYTLRANRIQRSGRDNAAVGPTGSLTCSREESNQNRHRSIIAVTIRNVIALMMAALAIPGCTSSIPSQTITVLAAASMTNVLPDIVLSYERGHPGTRVRVSYAGSSTLAAQVRTGIGADVLITASRETMNAAGTGVRQFRVFARNSIVLASATSKVSSIADLNRESVIWIRCDDAVPCGQAAMTALKSEGITSQPASLDADVNAVMGRLRSGEADAGVVYRTSLIGQDHLRAIPFSHPTYVDLCIAQVANSSLPDEAQDFINYVIGSADILTAHGFEVVKT